MSRGTASWITCPKRSSRRRLPNMFAEREMILPASVATMKSGTTNSFLLAATTGGSDPLKESARICPPSPSRISSNQAAMRILTSKKRTFPSAPAVTTYPFWNEMWLIELWCTRMTLDARFSLFPVGASHMSTPPSSHAVKACPVPGTKVETVKTPIVCLKSSEFTGGE